MQMIFNWMRRIFLCAKFHIDWHAVWFKSIARFYISSIEHALFAIVIRRQKPQKPMWNGMNEFACGLNVAKRASAKTSIEQEITMMLLICIENIEYCHVLGEWFRVFFFFFDCSASHGNDDDWFSFNKIDVMARCGWCAGAWPHQDEDKVFNINRLRQKSTSSVDMAFWLLQNGWLCVQFIIFTINVLWDNLHNSLTKMISLQPVSKSFSRVFHAIVEKLPNQNAINWIWSW